MTALGEFLNPMDFEFSFGLGIAVREGPDYATKVSDVLLVPAANRAQILNAFPFLSPGSVFDTTVDIDVTKLFREGSPQVKEAMDFANEIATDLWDIIEIRVSNPIPWQTGVSYANHTLVMTFADPKSAIEMKLRF